MRSVRKSMWAKPLCSATTRPPLCRLTTVPTAWHVGMVRLISAHRIVYIDLVAEDIDPVQQLVIRIPNGPFADERVLFHD